MHTSGSDWVDWFALHEDFLRVGRPNPPSKKAAAFTETVWPMANRYYSPLNPAFAMEFDDEAGLPERGDVFMARDGLVPLLWFFRQKPEPGRFRGKLLVHESLASFVPNAWAERTYRFRITSLARGAGPTSGNLLVLGLVMPGYCSFDHLRESAEKIGRAVRARDLSPFAFLPVRFGASADPRMEFHFDFIQTILRGVGSEKPLNSLTWAAINTTPTFAGWEVFDLSDGSLIRDNSLVHQLLAKGATLFESEPAAKPDTNQALIELSPHHGVLIDARSLRELGISGQDAFPDATILSEIAKAMRSDANSPFPWPLWFDPGHTG